MPIHVYVSYIAILYILFADGLYNVYECLLLATDLNLNVIVHGIL